MRQLLRKMKNIDRNTFGGSKAAENLVDILNEMEDKMEARKLLWRISKIYCQYTKGVKEITANFESDHWRNSFLRLWFEHFKGNLAKNMYIPIYIKGYVANIEKALYRRAIRGEFNGTGEETCIAD